MASIISAGTTSGTSLNLSGDTSGVLQLATNGSTTAVTIDTSQNVGIGTASPVEKVQSSRGIAATGANQSVGSLDGFVADYSSGISRMFASRNGVATGTMAFWTTDSTGTAAERMRIDSSGNVGIGTSSPSAKLHVAGIIQSESTGKVIQLQQSGEEGYINMTGTSSIIFRNGASFTERMRILSTGNILCLSGGSTTANGTGIAFPATQSASSDANTLDDYEEGTWTPSIGYSGGNGTMSISYANQFGWYTKIGNVVYLRCDIRLTSFSKGTASGSPWIVGLPFTPQNNGGYGSAVFVAGIYQWTYSSTPPIASVNHGGVPAIYLQRMVSNGASASLDDPDGDSMIFQTVIYQV